MSSASFVCLRPRDGQEFFKRFQVIRTGANQELHQSPNKQIYYQPFGVAPSVPAHVVMSFQGVCKEEIEN